MTEFVGAEYLIARMLIEKQKQKPEISTISTAELNRLGICVRRLSIEEKVGAVFLTSREEVYSAVYDYSDYFQCIYDEDNKLSGIRINENKSADDLNVKFIKYLPDAIIKLLNDAIREIAA